MRLFRSGVYTLDHLLGGGLSAGLLEVWGNDSAGKSTLALSFLRECFWDRDIPGIVHLDGLIDTDYSFNAGPRNGLVSHPGSGEEAIDAAYRMLKVGTKVLVIDSLPNMIPRFDMEKPIDANFTNSRRRLVSHGLHFLSSEAKARGALIIAVNQARNTITEGVKPYLHATTALYSDHRFTMWNVGVETEYGAALKRNVHVRVDSVRRHVKEDMDLSISCWHEIGIRPEHEATLLLEERGIIERKGAWWTVPNSDEKIGPGRAKAYKYMRVHWSTYHDIVKEVVNDLWTSSEG